MKRMIGMSVGIVALGLWLAGCTGDGSGNPDAGDGNKAKADGKAKTDGKAKVEPPKEIKPPTPVQEKLEGGPYPTLLVTQAWFWKNAAGKPNPGPARLELWRETPEGWRATRLEDGDSNVFHKAIAYEGGIITIGAEGANLKRWTFANGAWTGELLWHGEWGGKYNRLRDLEIGDVDGDGKDEFVMASHDAGVVAVYNPDTKETVELDRQPDIFVHEIELGDVDGDGKKEFFATPTGRNTANASQGGQLVMYRWDGGQYVRTVVDPFGETHAKEVLTVDLDGDGKHELFSVVEAEAKGKEITKPVEVRQYTLQADGSFTSTVIATIQDRQTRFLVPGDFDGDGKVELIAAAMKTGLWLLDPAADGTWAATQIDVVSSGFEHTSYAADLDGDGTLELYVAADDQQELKKYVWDPEKKAFKKTLLGRLAENTITWNITTGSF